MLSLCCNVGSVRILCGRKAPKVDLLSANTYGGAKQLAVSNFVCASQPGCADSAMARIPDIRCLVNITKVSDSVVGAVAVNVVYDSNRPRTIEMQPSEAVHSVKCAINSRDKISAPVVASNGRPGSNVGYALSARHYPGFMVVVDKLAQSLRGKIGLSHDALQMLIGQRPAFVASELPASLFSQMRRIAAIG